MATKKYCTELVRQYDYNHYLTTLFQPSQSVRDCVFAIRAFNVEIARIQDNVKEPAIAAMRFKWWQDTLGETFKGRPVDHPVSKELARSLRENSLSKLWFSKLINGRVKHLQRTNFQNLDELEQYAEQTVSSIFYLHLESLRVRNANIEHACGHLGKAIGIVTILRSVPHSLPSVLIPTDILIKHRVSTQELIRTTSTSIRDGSASLNDAIFEVATRANDQLLTAKTFLEKEELDQNGICSLLPMVPLQLYLKSLEKANFNIFSPNLNRKSLYLPFAIWRASRQRSAASFLKN
jgi:NADH dehydrogenase [ubiquinone] 1 alpha subcomplex assembly factor 6